MKSIALALLFSLPSFGAYTGIRSITIAHTQVGSSDSSNFPIVVSGTYSYLATTANGGSVTNSSGFDIVFTSDSACSTNLHFQRALYTATSGLVQFWVKLPTLSHTSDTVIYECYGNSSVTTDQQDATGTWDSNYRAVYHLQEASSPYLDSTANAINSTSGTYPTQVAGLFGKAQQFVSASSQFIQFPDAAASSSTSVTFSGWIKPTTSIINVLYDDRVNTGQHGGVLYADGSSHASVYFNNVGTASGSTNLNDSNWHYIVGVMHFATPSDLIYVDGALITTVATGAWGGFGLSASARIGASADATPLYANATMQEIRFSATERSADWILAEYNNQKAGSTMLTISSNLATAGNSGGMILQ